MLCARYQAGYWGEYINKYTSKHSLQRPYDLEEETREAIYLPQNVMTTVEAKKPGWESLHLKYQGRHQGGSWI